MMETKEMIYTAIFQGAQGKLTRSRYTGVISRKDAWLSAARMGASDNMCLIALVPGDHPAYFYEDFVADNARSRSREHGIRHHDLFEVPPIDDEEVFEMT